MSLIDRLRSVEVSARAAVICIVVLLAAVVVVIVVAKNAASTAPARPKAKPTAETKRVRVNITQAKPKVPTPAPAAKPEDKNPYSIIAERNLFRPVTGGGAGSRPAGKPPSPGQSGGAPVLAMLKPGMLPPMPLGGAPSPAPPSDDFKKSLAFTGVVQTTAGTQALLENLKTKETRFAARGDSAFGCRLVDISQQSVMLEKDGATFRLNIGENKPDAEAAGAAKPAGEQKPPQPGGEQKPPQPSGERKP